MSEFPCQQFFPPLILSSLQTCFPPFSRLFPLLSPRLPPLPAYPPFLRYLLLSLSSPIRSCSRLCLLSGLNRTGQYEQIATSQHLLETILIVAGRPKDAF